MRARFYKNTEGRYPPIAFGTFHSIFYQIIRTGGNDKAVLIDAARRQRLLVELQRQFFPEITEPDDVELLSGVICRSREQGRPCPRGDYKRPEAITLAVHAYESYLRENHLIDYDGMILLCRDMLRSDAELLRSIQHQYAFVLVDEFQDISASQYEILRLLYDREADMPHALFVVGDDDQSIYGFRGADPVICRQFLQDYPDAHRIDLAINYRSVSPIVQSAGVVIAENRNRIDKTIVSGKPAPTKATSQGAPAPSAKQRPPQGPAIPAGRAVACKSFADRDAQWAYLVKVVTAMDARTRKESAIIFRTNRQLRICQQALARAGLLPGDLAIPENPWIHRVHSLYQGYMAFGAEVRQDCIHRDTYARIMNVPERFLLRESMPQERATRREFLTVYPTGSRTRQSMAELVEQAECLCDLPERQRIRYFRIVIGIEADLVQRANGSDVMRQQIREAFEDLAANPNAPIAEEHAVPRDADRRQRTDLQADHIHLMTMHACKGLEYDNVYLPDLNEGLLPTRKAHTQDAIEEERRLFYVAMTRAKEHLELLYVKGSAENPATPTRFLLPLGIGPRYSQ